MGLFRRKTEKSDDESRALKQLLGTCIELKNAENIEKIGLLSSIEMSNVEAVKSIRQTLENTLKESMQLPVSGSFENDVLQWFITVSPSAPDTLVEVNFYSDLYISDSVKFIRYLGADESPVAHKAVRSWSVISSRS